MAIIAALLLSATALVAWGGQNDRDGEDGFPVSSHPISVLIYREDEETRCKDVTSGAVLFSSTDSGEIIQRAMDQAPQGGRMLVSAGEYHLERPVELIDNFRLEGEGPGTIFYGESTVSFLIEERSNVTLGNFVLLGSGPIVIAGHSEPASDISIMDITATIDSSHEGAFYTLALNTKVSNISFIRCTALNCGTNGFINNGDYERGWVENISYVQCRAIGCGLASRYNDWVVGFDLAERVNIRNMSVRDCESTNNWQSGFHFEPPAIVENAELRNCSANNNGRSVGAPGGSGYGWGYLLYDRPWHDIRLLDCTASGNWRGDTDLGPLSSELRV